MGMLRSLKFAKYLPYYGWKPIILTVAASSISPIHSQYWLCDEAEGNLPHVRIIRTPFVSFNSLYRPLCSSSIPTNKTLTSTQLIKRSTSNKLIKTFLKYIWNEWVLFPDSVIGWYPFAVKKAIDYIRAQNINLIFSTSLPVTSHIIANAICKKTGLPWVTDFRDAWSQPHYKTTSRLRAKLDKVIEIRTLRKANALVTVSEPLRLKLLNIHKQFSDRSFVIYNGFDPDDYGHPLQNKENYFNITFTGRMYDIDFNGTGRNPRLLFNALNQLFQEGKLDPNKVRCDIYGEYPYQLEEMILNYNLQNLVRCFGPVPFRKSFTLQQNSTILLLLTWSDLNYKGVVTGKIFEYLGARKNILAIPFYNDDVARILHDTKAGVLITDLSELKSQLYEWYQEYNKKGAVNYRGIESELEKYSRKQATKALSEIFNTFSHTSSAISQ